MSAYRGLPRDWRARKGSATFASYGKKDSNLPGDLGPNDPRRRRPSDLADQKTTAQEVAQDAKSRRYSDGSLLKIREDIKSSTDDGGGRLSKDPDDEEAAESDSESEKSEEDDEDDDEDEGDASEQGRGRVRDSERDRGLVPADEAALKSPDPTITVTPPNAELNKHPNTGVHPHSAYDHPMRAASPARSDDEEHLSELRRAQRLSLTVSQLHSTPSAHRVIRQIIRGDYASFQREGEEGRRRQRMYLVATDLSPEAEYALEWTIGTVLRDGDTLFAVYAVDEEGGTGSSEGVEIGHGADVVKDTASIVGALSAERIPGSPARRGVLPRDSSAMRLPGAGAAEREGMSKAERERYRAAEEVSDRCVKLLRKTRLQIRVVVEVFHCKSPRHMITEVIDYLSPTLTILGSRGRSALKGVLLGSFSNYLVTKSSVPVMVARKRLRKHPKKRFNKDGLPIAYAETDGRKQYGRMSNVLEAPVGSAKRGNRLVGAKID